MHYKLPSLSSAEILNAIQSLGIRPGSVVYSASSLASISHLQEPEKIAMRALDEAVGPHGNLVMPAGCPDFRQNGFFNRENSPSSSGILTEHFRRLQDVVRTFAPPFNTVCARGNKAAQIGNVESQTQFSSKSVYQLLIDLDTWVVLLGCNFHDGVAHMHWLEERHKVPYREWKNHTGTVICNGVATTRSFSHFTRLRRYTLNYKPLDTELRAAGCIRDTQIGLMKVTAFRLSDFVSVLDPWFKKNWQQMIVEEHNERN